MARHVYKSQWIAIKLGSIYFVVCVSGCWRPPGVFWFRFSMHRRVSSRHQKAALAMLEEQAHFKGSHKSNSRAPIRYTIPQNPLRHTQDTGPCVRWGRGETLAHRGLWVQAFLQCLRWPSLNLLIPRLPGCSFWKENMNAQILYPWSNRPHPIVTIFGLNLS